MSTSIEPTRSRRPSPPARHRCAALLLASLAAAGAASAAAGEAPAVTVRYGDLNLASDAGTQVLLRRLSAAAHRVCGDDSQRDLTRLRHAQACFRESLSSAVVAVHNERLSMLYRERSGAGAT